MSLAENKSQKKIEILECTLRDGSYPVDFKFTLQDTALLTRLLADIGFKYIEVGHGVGLGAARAGKGQTPWPDEEAIRVAKSTIGDRSAIGVFCIADIATFDDMKRAADAGLDFIRIGQNAPDMHTAIPYIKEALRLGLTPGVNFMKSYAITPEDFGEKAKMVADEGAETVCVVDSA
ncbi:4-hydroxy-2-oxovalerate aldolase, partial [Candidatus Poribacteria bacterium]